MKKVIILLLIIVAVGCYVGLRFINSYKGGYIFGNRGKNMSEDINESMRRKVFVARMIPIESDTFYMDNDTYFYFDITGFIEYSWVQGDFFDETILAGVYDKKYEYSCSVVLPIQSNKSINEFLNTNYIDRIDTSYLMGFSSDDILSCYKNMIFTMFYKFETVPAVNDTIKVNCYKVVESPNSIKRSIIDTVRQFKFIVK